MTAFMYGEHLSSLHSHCKSSSADLWSKPIGLSHG